MKTRKKKPATIRDSVVKGMKRLGFMSLQQKELFVSCEYSLSLKKITKGSRAGQGLRVGGME
ncbi:MAG: hypothetical protein P8017_05620 [Deltaproteobacteria bacterium]